MKQTIIDKLQTPQVVQNITSDTTFLTTGGGVNHKKLLIDSTLLNEQLCPNEFWLDGNGITKRQVFQKTFHFQTHGAAGGNYIDNRGIYSQIKIINAQCVTNNELGDYLSLSDYALGNTNENKRWLLELYLLNNAFVYTITNPVLFNKVVNVTIKYTKV